jgi:hypothetical protein
MNPGGWFMVTNTNSVFCVVMLTVVSLFTPRTNASEAPFRAYGRIALVNFKNGAPFETNFTNVKAVFAQGKWCIYLSASEEAESAVYFDGANQFAVSHNKDQPLGQPLNGFVAESEVPYGGGLGQTAWFHFCRQRWTFQARDAFPNLTSYEGKLGFSNVKLTLTEQNGELDASFDFVHGDMRWPVEKWHAEGVDKATGVPRYSERKIYSRVGTMLSGKLILPPVGSVFDKEIQIARTEVSKIEIGDFSNELIPSWLGHGLINMVDKRFSSDGSMIVYTVTNRIPTKAEMWRSGNA